MSGFNPRPFSPTFGSKVEVTAANSAGTSQLIGNLTGPIQVRLVNYDTAARIAYRFGTKAAADAVTIAGNPTLPFGSLEVITVHPNPDGSPVYWNTFGDTGVTGKFEVTLGQGL